MNCSLSRTSRNAASSRGISGSYSARTSTRGIVCTRGHSSRRPSPVHPIRQPRDDACRDRKLHVAEVVLEVAVALTERVADAEEGERPDGRAEESKPQELRERHLEQPRRNRDERAEDGGHRPDQDTRPAPAPEPGVCPVQPIPRDAEPAAVALKQLAPSPAADQPADE